MTTKQQRQALALSLFTVGYNLVEGAVGLYAAAASGSSALLSFGLDSFVESLSGCVMIWRFWPRRSPNTTDDTHPPPEPRPPDAGQDISDSDDESIEAIERRAAGLVAWSLFLLAAYVTFGACYALYRQEPPEVSHIGLALAAASLVIMPVLFVLKHRLGKSIGSPSLVADSKETLACVLLSAALLIGLGTFAFWQTWWIDPIAALVIAALIVREGFKALEEAGEGDARFDSRNSPE